MKPKTEMFATFVGLVLAIVAGVGLWIAGYDTIGIIAGSGIGVLVLLIAFIRHGTAK